MTIAFVHFDGSDDLVDERPGEGRRRGSSDLISERPARRRPAGRSRSSAPTSTTTAARSSSPRARRRAPATTRTGCCRVSRRSSSRARVAAAHRRQPWAGVRGRDRSAYRRTFTVMGDTVNLAARVMARAAPGEILATESVRGIAHRVRDDGPRTVPGEGQSEAGHRVLGGRPVERRWWPPPPSRRSSGVGPSSTRCCGRCGPRSRVKAHWWNSSANPASGSRAWSRSCGKARAMVQIAAACEPYESSTPYFPFRTLLREQLGFPATITDDESRPSSARSSQSWIRSTTRGLRWWPG